MPYEAKGKCVYKKDSGEKVGCTDGSIEDYLAALHANVKKENKRVRITKEHLKKIVKEELFREVLEPGSGSPEEWKSVERQNVINLLAEDGVSVDVDSPITNEQLHAMLMIARGQTSVTVKDLREVRSERHPQGKKIATDKEGMKPYDQGYQAGTKGDRSEMPLEQYGTPFYDAWMAGWDDGLANFHR